MSNGISGDSPEQAEHPNGLLLNEETARTQLLSNSRIDEMICDGV